MQREIGDRLAKAILSGEITDGDTVLVDTAADVDELTIEGLEALGARRRRPRRQRTFGPPEGLSGRTRPGAGWPDSAAIRTGLGDQAAMMMLPAAAVT